MPLVADDSVGKGPLSRFLVTRERLALLIVTTPWSASSDAAARLRDAFKLTPAEVKLAVALMQGSSTGSYARSRGIAPNTARNQLRSLLEKTATHRQAELVAVLFSALGHSNSVMIEKSGQRAGRGQERTSRSMRHDFASVLQIAKFVPRLPRAETNFAIRTLARGRGLASARRQS